MQKTFQNDNLPYYKKLTKQMWVYFWTNY